MKCEDVIIIVQRQLDERQSLRLPAGAARHIEQCESCRAAVEELACIDSKLAAVGEDSQDRLPAGFHGRFMARLANEPAPSGAAHPWHSSALAYAAMAAAALLVIATILIPTPQMEQHLASATPTPATSSTPVPEVSTNAGTGLIQAMQSLPRITDEAETLPYYVYGDVGAEVREFTLSFYDATSVLAEAFVPAGSREETAQN